MRDALLLVVILASVPICLFRPYFGVLMWFIISFLNPRGYVYGIAAEFPAAELIAIPTILGTFFTETNKRFLPKQTILLFLFWGWIVVSYLHATQVPLFAGHVGESLRQLSDVSKTLLMTLITILVVTSKQKLRYLMLATSFCLGLLALKGAVFGVLTGGEYRVYGTHRSFLADNNDFALALNMVLAIPFFLARQENSRKLRFILYLFFVASIISIVLTYSRGGLLGLTVALAGIAIKSGRKIAGFLIAGFLILSLFIVAPARWQDRMTSLLHGELDDSAEQRLVTWGYSWNFAMAYPITGGSFGCFTPPLFAIYQPRPLPSSMYKALGPHSIYFQVLAEQGFPGVVLFFGLLISCLLTLRKLRKVAKLIPHFHWMKDYIDMIAIGLAAYLVNGTFLGRAYFDLYYELVATVLIIQILYAKAVAQENQELACFQPENIYVTA